MIKRVEFKVKEEKEFMEKYMVIKEVNQNDFNIHPIITRSCSPKSDS